MLLTRLVAVIILWLPATALAKPSDHGAFSRSAIQIWAKLPGNPNPVVVQSPDGKSRVAAKWYESGGKDNDEHVVLTSAGQIGTLRFDIGPGVDSELLWSPDSKAFFVTFSDGGMVGDYHLIVAGRFQGRLQRRELTTLVRHRFGNPVRCFDPSEPNVMGIGWVGLTHRVWAAAQVIADTNCDSMGTFRAYEVDPAAMKILSTLNQIEAKRQLKPILGDVLRQADDRCIRNPRSCYVNGLHPRQDSK